MSKLDVKLTNIINHYRRLKSNNPDTWIEHCRLQTNLFSAIKFAALSVNGQGKRHPHQYRLKQFDLAAFAELLLQQEFEISQTINFDELFTIIEQTKAAGIGALAKYDTATRIAAFLNYEPDKIYLHAGTKKGASNLLNRRLSSNTLSKSDLPAVFQSSNLTCAEIEDILCIYKDRFKSDVVSA